MIRNFLNEKLFVFSASISQHPFFGRIPTGIGNKNAELFTLKDLCYFIHHSNDKWFHSLEGGYLQNFEHLLVSQQPDFPRTNCGIILSSGITLESSVDDALCHTKSIIIIFKVVQKIGHVTTRMARLLYSFLHIMRYVSNGMSTASNYWYVN